jgi:C4-type Zn-finger protein
MKLKPGVLSYKILPNGQLVCPICGSCASTYPDGIWQDVPYKDVPGAGYFATVCPKCNFVFKEPYMGVKCD